MTLLGSYFDNQGRGRDTPVRISSSVSEEIAVTLAEVGNDHNLTASATIRCVLEMGLVKIGRMSPLDLSDNPL